MGNATRTTDECPAWCAREDEDHQAGQHGDEWEGVTEDSGVLEGEAASVRRIWNSRDLDYAALLAVVDDNGTEVIVKLAPEAAAQLAELLTQAVGL
jgi:hypothetical protein